MLHLCDHLAVRIVFNTYIYLFVHCTTIFQYSVLILLT